MTAIVVFIIIYFLQLSSGGDVMRDSKLCPCNDAVPLIHKDLLNSSSIHSLCFFKSEISLQQRNMLQFVIGDKFSVMFIQKNFIIPDDNSTMGCDVIIRFYDSAGLKRRLMPASCEPIPEILMTSLWLDPGPKVEELLTETMSVNMISTNPSTDLNVGSLLEQLFWRRQMECRERRFWLSAFLNHRNKYKPLRTMGSSKNSKSHQPRTDIPRRKVKAVVVWVGTATKMDLIRSQAQVLASYPTSGVNAVLGWAATEATYSCREGSTKCLSRARSSGSKYLPGSTINRMSEGWACAQRRPLRALSHVLLLLDPDFVVLADDDTYVNYKLLLQTYGQFIAKEMKLAPIVMGEFVGRTGQLGHLTTQGLFAGGSGYILGRSLLERLVAYEVRDWRSMLRAVYLGKYLNKNRNGHTNYVTDLFGRTKENTASVSRSDKDTTLTDSFVPWADPYRSLEQITHLSLTTEGILLERNCRSNPPLVSSLSPVTKSSPTTTRPTLPPPFPLPAQCLRTDDQIVSRSKLVYLDRSNCNYYGTQNGCGTGPSVVEAALKTNTYDGKLRNPDPLKYLVRREEYLPIGVRLIDFCMNLMANENTCLHSDHSLGRCLIYGAFATPVGVVCEATIGKKVNNPSSPEVRAGLCFMAPECNASRHVTCHRYMAGSVHDAVGHVLPVKISNDLGQYKKYSSGFDGTTLDSYM